MINRGARLDIRNEITKNKFLLILLPENKYSMNLKNIIKGVDKKHKSICYVCLSRPYLDVKEEMNKENIDTKRFFFVDVLSSHYKTPPEAEDCIFIKEPINVSDLKVAITKGIKDKGCGVILMDPISELLLFEQNHSILRFTHELTREKGHENVKKLFLVLKEAGVLGEESEKLVRDLEMLADKMIDLNHM